ncbi:MAG: cell wall hydrolase, partial [Proteobacteria bacterium]|nr:cell wall hydrolase [Pseudomonadota bacterium]
LQYVLSNVLLSEYCAFCDADNGHLEFITLNFTDIEISFILYDDRNTPTSTVRAQAAVGCQPSLATHVRRQIQTRTPEGFNLFVATIYAEAGEVRVGREAAWQAVGSVIMNRINTGVWWRRKTSDEVIQYSGFDAYLNPNSINWNQLNFKDKHLSKHIKDHQEFLKAWATLNNQQINHKDAMTKDEQELLYKMRAVLIHVYNGQVTTPANYYYSPRAMHGKQPSFLSHLEKPEQYQVSVLGIREHDFKFYYISAHTERTARKK